MRAFGFTGYSGAGKTTLIESLVRMLGGLAVTTSVVKHTHHDFDLDQPGKDSHRMREAGAVEVLLVGAHRWVLMREQSDERANLATQLDRLDDVELVLVEGFRDSPLPKLEVWRSVDARAPRFADDESIIALAVDGEAPPACSLPVFQLDDIAGIVAFVMARAVSREALPC